MIHPTKADVAAGRRVTLKPTDNPKSLPSSERGVICGFHPNGVQILLDSALDFSGFRSYTTHPYVSVFWEHA